MDKIDKNVRPVVAAVKACHLETLGSCGGHKHPGKWQHPNGQWFVSFLGHAARIARLKKLARKLGITMRKGKPYKCVQCLKCNDEDKLVRDKDWYYIESTKDPKLVAYILEKAA